MNPHYKNATVGLIVILGLVVFTAGSLWLRGRTIRSPDVQVLFADIGNLKEGAPVRVSGAPVGRVSEIEFMAVGRVRVGLTLNVAVHTTRGAKASITGVGMLGDAVITFDPGQGPPLQPGDTVRGTMAAGLFDKGAELADKASSTLTSLQAMLDKELIVDLRQSLKTSQELMSYLKDQKTGPTAEINATMRSLQSTTAVLDSTLKGLDAKKLQGGLDSTMRSSRLLFDRLAGATTRMDSLMAKIQRGDGTMGKLATDSMLYVDLRKTLQATTDLINDIKKNPGKIGVTIRIP
jgi:phospholipid/cholesterol/gamma-HCH transport system substrate-binding protein